MKSAWCRLRVNLLTALPMLRSRWVRATLVGLQFTIAFSALIILYTLIGQTQATVNRLKATFTPQTVLGLYPAKTEAGDAESHSTTVPPALKPADLAALEAMPGIERAAVLRQATASLETGSAVSAYFYNDAFASLSSMRLVKRLNQEAPEPAAADSTWVYLTPAAERHLRQHGPLPSVLSVRSFGKALEARVAGVVDLPAGWPNQVSEPISDFASDPVALVMKMEAVGPELPIVNSVWLVLENSDQVEPVRSEVAAWFQQRNPTYTLLGVSVEEEIARNSTSRSPAVWAAGVLATLLLLLAGLGFAGQVMHMAESRKTEWATRLMLGATTLDLAVQVVAESFLVVFVATLASLLLTAPFLPLISKTQATTLPWLLQSSLAAPLIAVLITCAVSAYPLWRVSQIEPSSLLREDW
jgi:hypothetical protein